MLIYSRIVLLICVWVIIFKVLCVTTNQKIPKKKMMCRLAG